MSERERRRLRRGSRQGLPHRASGCARKRVLRGVSFRVREGEIFGFVGPNGAGKTTTLKVLMGLIRADRGRARRSSATTSRETEYRRQVGFLPENPYFYDYLTGREILDFYARLSRRRRARRARARRELLEWVGLAHAADARLRTYSKGMLQRIGIAQALMHDPQRGVPRRADERPRPDRPQGDPRPDPARCAPRARPCS